MQIGAEFKRSAGCRNPRCYNDKASLILNQAWSLAVTGGLSTPMQKLTLREAHWQAMLEHVRQHSGEEACGLLSGANGQAERVYLIENTLHSPVEYYMDPVEQVRAMLEIEAAGLEVCAIFHSHPVGPPVPSQTDVERSYYPDSVYIIMSPRAANGWGARGFLIDQGVVREVALEIAA
jgi:proteasome lid subunit RPN8/RPN11